MRNTKTLALVFWINGFLPSGITSGPILESTPCSNWPGYVSFNSTVTNGTCYKYFDTLARQYEAETRYCYIIYPMS